MNKSDSREPSDASRLTVVGDVMPGRKVALSLAQLGLAQAVQRIRNVLGDAPAVGNLECPLSDAPPKTALKQDGSPNLYAAPSLAPFLRDAGFLVLSLANNHALDCEPAGLIQTIDALTSAGIQSVGAGRNITEALQPAMLDINNRRVALLAFGNGRPAGEDTPGVAPFQSAALRRGLSGMRKRADAVIVLVHAGLEFLPHPESWTRNFAREALSCGADAVLGGHPHCIRGIWRGSDGPIAYGLGDFLADTADPESLVPHLTRTALTNLGFSVDPSLCRQGLVAQLTIAKPHRVECDVRPILIDDDFLPGFPKPQQQQMLESTIESLSAAIADRNSEGCRLARQVESAYRQVYDPPRTLRTMLTMPLRVRPRHIGDLWRRITG